jgi:Family of unknown function (DUF6515)
MKSRSSAAIHTIAAIGLLVSTSVFAGPNRMIETEPSDQNRNHPQKPPRAIAPAPAKPVAPPPRAEQRDPHAGHRDAHAGHRDPHAGHRDARHHNDRDHHGFRPGPARPPVYAPPPAHNYGRWGHAHWHDGQRYHFEGTRWYRFNEGRYWTVIPPFGLWIWNLPPNYRSQWVGASQYYYSDGVYYQNSGNGYVVVAAPVVSQPVVQPIAPPPPVSVVPAYPGYTDFIRGIYVYPRGTQTEARTTADKQECAQWAGTQVLGNAWAGPVNEPQQTDYRRAMGACLDARNYSVR